MTHKWDKHYNKVFVLLVVIGIALCVGGVWLAPLLVPGGIALTAAGSMYASAFVRMYPWEQDEVVHTSPGVQSVTLSTPPTVSVHIDDHHVEFHPHYDMILRPSRPSLEMMEMHQSHSAPELTLTGC